MVVITVVRAAAAAKVAEMVVFEGKRASGWVEGIADDNWVFVYNYSSLHHLIIGVSHAHYVDRVAEIIDNH